MKKTDMPRVRLCHMGIVSLVAAPSLTWAESQPAAQQLNAWTLFLRPDVNFVPPAGSLGRVNASFRGIDPNRLPLKVWLQARTLRGKPCGEINGPGSSDDFALVDSSGSSFYWSPPTNGEKTILTAFVRDSAGKTIKKSLPLTMQTIPLTLQVATSRWVRDGDGFMRFIRVTSGFVRRNSLYTGPPTPFRMVLQLPAGAPAASSWLEQTGGKTNPSGDEWTTKQHWRALPNAPLKLDQYKVIARPIAAVPVRVFEAPASPSAIPTSSPSRLSRQ